MFRKLLAGNQLDEVNVKQLVLELRKQRVSMVQTASQYLFLNRAIASCCRETFGSVWEGDEPMQRAEEVCVGVVGWVVN